MTYSKGEKVIAVEMNPLLGKVKPELYVGEGTSLVKVACFGSVKKAEMFEEWLQFFFGNNLVRECDNK